MASDATRLLGIAPVTTGAPTHVPSTAAPTQVPWAVDALAIALESASSNDEAFSLNERELREAILEQAILDHSSLPSALERWNAKRGPEVLALAGRGSLQTATLAISVLQLVAGSEPRKREAADFAATSGIRDFCLAHADEIRSELVAHFNDFENASNRWNVAGTRTGRAVTEGFASVLPWVCPNILSTPRLMRIAFAHRSLAIRVAVPYRVEQIFMQAYRSSVWLESLPVLLGPSERLQRGIADFRFSGERATDGRSVLWEWFSEMTRAMSDPSIGLFTPHGSQIAVADKTSANWERKFLALGRFLALAVLHENPVGVALPITFFARLINQRLTLDDIREEDPELHSELSRLLTAPEAELENFRFTIQGEVFVPTIENRDRIVDLTVNALFTEGVEDEFAAIRTGFNAVFSLEPRHLFGSAADWRAAIAGIAPADVEDVLASLNFVDGYTCRSRQMQWLRTVLREYSCDQLQAFLRFVTGHSYNPNDIIPRITVGINGATGPLPTAFPRAFTLHLPVYGSLHTLRSRLTSAISQQLPNST